MAEASNAGWTERLRNEVGAAAFDAVIGFAQGRSAQEVFIEYQIATLPASLAAVWSLFSNSKSVTSSDALKLGYSAPHAANILRGLEERGLVRTTGRRAATGQAGRRALVYVRWDAAEEEIEA